MNRTGKLFLSDDVRKQNRHRIIAQFRSSCVISRTEIGKRTNLSPGTVTNITTALLSEGIIRSAGHATDNEGSGYGRPRVLLELNPEFAIIVAGSLTFDGIKLNLIDYSGNTIAKLYEAYDLRGKNKDQIAKKIHEMVLSADTKTKPVLYIFGVQGLTDKDGQNIVWSPILSEDGANFNKTFSELTGAKVLLANDSSMIARSLAVENSDFSGSFAAVLMSYGIGMGLYLNGQPFHGISSSGLEFGHIPYKPEDGAQCRCGKTGCVEAYASDYGIWRSANGHALDKLPDQQITHSELAQIIERAEIQDGAERRAIKEAGRAIGFGLSTMFVLFDPFPVTFIGRASTGLSIMEEEIHKAIAENSPLRRRVDVVLDQKNDALAHIEKGCSIVALAELDQRVSFDP